MKQEKSCGVITYIVIDNEINYLLVEQNNGYTCFPKGHVENNETEEETALRECYEETGLKPKLVKGFRESIDYYMPDYDAMKEVVFFIGKIDKLDYHRQENEIKDIKLCKYEEAYNYLMFDNWQELLFKANEFIKKL